MDVILSVFRQIAQFFSEINTPTLTVLAAIGSVIAFTNFHAVPYAILGFFFTRKFSPAKKQHKYAILIPARNEASVIGNLLESIAEQDYPQELLTVFVVADNCTDQTAAIARANGAVCYEHNNPEERTKGFGLRYLFEQIKKDYGIEAFEGYFVFDADNLLAKDYISRMNDSFDAGEKIITSYRATKNLNEGWICSTYALHWLRSIRTRHRARSVLHLATNIQGTGFLFANELVKDGWKYTSLTEDRAFTADAVVQGYEISYNDAAVFYDEQPTSLKVALRQRLRWSKGHLIAFVESGGGLLYDIFIDRNTVHKPGEPAWRYLVRTIRHRFMAFDTLGQLLPRNIYYAFRWIVSSLILYPCVCYVTGVHELAVFSVEGGVLADIMTYFFGNITISLPAGGNTYLACFLISVWLRILYRLLGYLSAIWIAIYVFIVEHKRIMRIPFYKKVLYCLTWPVFDIIGRYTQYLALFVHVEWKPIPHNSKITIKDLNRPA